jgi:hypothetical protein
MLAQTNCQAHYIGDPDENGGQIKESVVSKCQKFRKIHRYEGKDRAGRAAEKNKF